MKKMMAVLFGTFAIAGAAMADNAGGTLQVTGSVVSSMSLTIESAGGTSSGTGTSAASTALGNISKYGSAPTGFSLARGASNWTLSATVGVKVAKANLSSSDYTLTADLNSAPATGIVWKLNGTTLSTSASTLTSSGTYGSTSSYSWDIVVADSAATGDIDNIINFTATSN